MWATPGFIHPASLAMGPSGNYDVSGRNNSAERIAADDLAPTWPGVQGPREGRLHARERDRSRTAASPDRAS